MTNNIYDHLPGLAANARRFVSQVDAPTLHDRLNKLATACDEAHAEIAALREQVAGVRKDAQYAEVYIKIGNKHIRLYDTDCIKRAMSGERSAVQLMANDAIVRLYEAISEELNHDR